MTKPGRPWYLYLLACADGTTYTGITTDVGRRLAQHNAGQAARYTAAPSRRPVSLLGLWRFPDRSAATRAEHRFKRQSASRKRRLAQQRADFLGASFCQKEWNSERMHGV